MQGLDRATLSGLVREYGNQMGSVRHLLSDLTIPILSLFSGTRFDAAMKRIFSHGPEQIEDLWLR